MSPLTPYVDDGTEDWMEGNFRQTHFFTISMLKVLGNTELIQSKDLLGVDDQKKLKKETTCQIEPEDDSSTRCGRGSAYYCSKDLRIQCKTSDILDQTGWYYPEVSSQIAKNTLRHCSEGTFIIRNSSDSKYLYSISVKTSRGATSVRVLYHKGFYQLDCEEKLKHKMPRFDCVVQLIDFYVRLSRQGKTSCRWLESSGRKDLPVVLSKPKRMCSLGLKHLCRLTINNSLPDSLHITKTKEYIDKLPLPKSLADYMKEYPYLQ